MPKEQQIAFVGGSFNPVHKGHRHLINHICQNNNFYKCLVVPAFSPPHKSHQQLIPFYHRVQMLKKMKTYCLFPDKIQISMVEQTCPLPSYTFYTLQAVEKMYPSSVITLVLGADTYNTLSSWFQYHVLLEKYHWYILQRSKMKIILQSQKSYIADHSLWDYSSTQVRALLCQYKAIQEPHISQQLQNLLDQDVLTYILQHNLFA